MSWEEVGGNDLDKVVVFLKERIQSSMFFLSNLEAHGLGSSDAYGMRVWAQTGSTLGVFGISNSGFILLQAPDARAVDWAATAPMWRGRKLLGCSGDSRQVADFLEATGLAGCPMAFNPEEPGYVLALDQMLIPDCAGFEVVPIDDSLRLLATQWRAVYHGEVLGTPEAQRYAAAAEDIDGYIARGSHRILFKQGLPVAMTGFNAQAGDAVQIGAVFTPPETRGQGLARRAVALHLAEARERGVKQAILFAANEPAARAYEAIGFQRKGSMSMAMFHGEDAQ
ncbi:putative GNAT family acetyltransferase [Shimia isoporae]|uniref:Putative GNAT family acetyltransferase n=1 Tax=Shimia isoporae TaxID=647720 RepID=A0A4R1N4Y4_9RHOB|nr:GNAT family N-acetyltransferase [Shimia isoporae]TCK99343.1 putative GNAT family acetyltransferase [Shimia isoporae]